MFNCASVETAVRIGNHLQHSGKYLQRSMMVRFGNCCWNGEWSLMGSSVYNPCSH